MSLQTDTLDALYLEISQFTRAKTWREIDMEKRLAAAEADAERFRWLVQRGFAWRDCYDDVWHPGEWLYGNADATYHVDYARGAIPAIPDECPTCLGDGDDNIVGLSCETCGGTGRV